MLGSSVDVGDDGTSNDDDVNSDVGGTRQAAEVQAGGAGQVKIFKLVQTISRKSL